MSEKRRGLAEYLAGGGLSQDMQDLSLNPPLTLTKWGGDALHAAGGYASEKLKPLGIALDQKLGTTGEQEDAASPDVFTRKPLLPGDAEPAPEQSELSGYLGLDPYALRQPGLFESLGQGMPVAAAAIAENEMTPGAKKAWRAPGIATSTPADRTRGYAERLAKIDPKTLRGANDGFPRPGESLKAMQDESVSRDAMESRGARPVEPPSVDDLRRRVAPVDDPFAYYDKGGPTRDRWQQIEVPGASHSATPNAPAIEAAAAAHDANRAVSDGMNFWPSHPNLYRPGEEANDAFRTSVRSGNREARGVMPGGKTRVVPASKDLPGQSELERYLAGLYGPRAK